MQLSPMALYALGGAALGFLTAKSKRKRTGRMLKFGAIGAGAVVLAPKAGIVLPLPSSSMTARPVVSAR